MVKMTKAVCRKKGGKWLKQYGGYCRFVVISGSKRSMYSVQKYEVEKGADSGDPFHVADSDVARTKKEAIKIKRKMQR